MPVAKSRTVLSFNTGNTSLAGCRPGSAFTRSASEKSSVTKTMTAVPERRLP